MKSFLLLLILISLSLFAFSQNTDSLATAVDKIHQAFIRTDNSEKGISQKELATLEQLYYQSQRAGYQLGIEVCGTDYMRQHIRRGAYQRAIEIGGEILASARSFRNSTTATEVYRMRGLAYSSLGLFNKSMEQYRLSVRATAQVKNKDFRHYLRAIAYENLTSYFEQTGQHLDSIEYYFKKSIQEAELIADKDSKIPSNYKFNAILYAHKDLADYYLNVSRPSQPRKAEEQIEIALKMNESEQGKVMISNKIAFLGTLCQSFYFQKAFDRAINYGLQGLQLESTAPSPYDRVRIYETLAKSYLAQNNKLLSGKYMNLYTRLNDSLQISEKKQASTAVTQLIASEKKTHSRTAFQIIMWALGVVLSVIVIVYVIWKTDSRSLHKKYEYLIGELREGKQRPAVLPAIPALSGDENDADATVAATPHPPDGDPTRPEELSEPANIGKTANSANSAISNETLSKLLIKLEKFERSRKYLSPDISLAFLSNYLGTNQTYLTELLKVHRGATYRNYINTLRIDYIKKKLYEDPLYREYKINHLAQECGFASRQVFIAVFKKQTGVPPSYYINQLKKGTA